MQPSSVTVAAVVSSFDNEGSGYPLVMAWRTPVRGVTEYCP